MRPYQANSSSSSCSCSSSSVAPSLASFNFSSMSQKSGEKKTCRIFAKKGYIFPCFGASGIEALCFSNFEEKVKEEEEEEISCVGKTTIKQTMTCPVHSFSWYSQL